jgi:hypothetical protein
MGDDDFEDVARFDVDSDGIVGWMQVMKNRKTGWVRLTGSFEAEEVGDVYTDLVELPPGNRPFSRVSFALPDDAIVAVHPDGGLTIAGGMTKYELVCIDFPTIPV